MPKRISITPHLTVEELEGRYRQATHPVERSHYQIIWLLAKGRRSEEVGLSTLSSSSPTARIDSGIDLLSLVG